LASELRGRAHGEAPNCQRAARGLEDEETEDDALRPEDEDTPVEIAPEAQSQSKASFFA